MSLTCKINKLEKLFKTLLNEEDGNKLLEAVKEGDFLWALDPNRDWQAFFNENKGKNTDDLCDLMLNKIATEAWADYTEEK